MSVSIPLEVAEFALECMDENIRQSENFSCALAQINHKEFPIECPAYILRDRAKAEQLREAIAAAKSPAHLNQKGERK